MNFKLCSELHSQRSYLQCINSFVCEFIDKIYKTLVYLKMSTKCINERISSIKCAIDLLAFKLPFVFLAKMVLSTLEWCKLQTSTVTMKAVW